jgi:F-type H+-transporting ATPase subunit b
MIWLAAIALSAAETAVEHEPVAIWQDPAFFVLIAFAIVIGVFWKTGLHKMIAGGLDKRAHKIADELDQARKFREEAQELLAQYQRRQREAEDEAKGIIEQAKRDAERLAAESREKINAQIERRAKAAEDKIARAEAQAIAEVRGQIADLAIETARNIIIERMDQGAQAALVEKAISELRGKLH